MRNRFISPLIPQTFETNSVLTPDLSTIQGAIVQPAQMDDQAVQSPRPIRLENDPQPGVMAQCL